MLPAAVPWRAFNEVVALAEKSGVEPPTDPMALAVFRLLRGQETTDPIVTAAYQLFRSSYRHVMDALALCAARDDVVEAELELRPGVYAVYKHLFFDRTVFGSVFEMRQYVEDLHINKETRDIYELALVEGPVRLLDRYRVGPRRSLDPQAVLDDMMGEAHSRAFEHRGRPITSRVAQESFKWGRAAASTALAMKNANTANRVSDALQQLEMALTHESHSKTPEELGVSPNEIVRGE